MVSDCCGLEYKEMYSEMFKEDKLLCSECNEYCNTIDLFDFYIKKEEEYRNNVPDYEEEENCNRCEDEMRITDYENGDIYSEDGKMPCPDCQE